MNWLDDSIPLYASSWMDSGNSYHFACHGRLPILVTFLAFVVVSALLRRVDMLGWFVLLTVATFSGFPLEMTWVALVCTAIVWTVVLASKKDRRVLLPALGLLWLGGASWWGLYQTEIVSKINCQHNMKNIMTAVGMYESDNDALPPDLSHLAGYLPARDRRCRQSSANPQYRLEVQGDRYTVSCLSGLHPIQEMPEPFSDFRTDFRTEKGRQPGR